MYENCGSASCAGEDDSNGTRENLHVQPQTPVLYVSRVEGDVAVEGGVLARLYLPEASDSRKHVEAAQVREIVLLNLVSDRRPRAHQAHVATEDVVELRQFVKGVLAEPAADAGDTRIVGDLEEHAVALVHVRRAAHGACPRWKPWCGTYSR